MDDYLFHTSVRSCRYVREKTNWLEIFNYSDPAYNTNEEHPLLSEEFDNFIYQRGAFAPPILAEGTHLIYGIRLVMQKDAMDPETFSPNTISLPFENYESMVHGLNLPFKAIEGTSVVGPFFWSNLKVGSEDSHLQIIFRKSDVRKKGKTRGWELMLSYSFRTKITTGFIKGTPSSDITDVITHTKAIAAQATTMHPILLPLIIISHDLSSKTDQRQRDARDWLRKMEHAISIRNSANSDMSVSEVEDLNRDLVECHAQVLWKPPQAYLEIIREMEAAMIRFRQGMTDELFNMEFNEIHCSFLGRLDFYRQKLKGLDSYARTTLERLNIQKSALYSIVAQREAISNLQMVEMLTDQRRLAHASKKDNNAMKRLSILGAIFLPGTFLASLFSMVFFNVDDNGAGGLGNLLISSQLWVYFVITIPLTGIIVGATWFWGRKRDGKTDEEAQDLEQEVEEMEQDIIAKLRERTRTWPPAAQKNGIGGGPEPGVEPENS